MKRPIEHEREVREGFLKKNEDGQILYREVIKKGKRKDNMQHTWWIGKSEEVINTFLFSEALINSLGLTWVNSPIIKLK